MQQQQWRALQEHRWWRWGSRRAPATGEPRNRRVREDRAGARGPLAIVVHRSFRCSGLHQA
eukprot:12898755-Alexandrium_andersonii.AAC.1